MLPAAREVSPMRVAILGTGDVGRALGKAFLAMGHEVKMGSRQAGNEKALAFVKETGGKAGQGSFAEVAKWGEWVVLATLGAANEAVIKACGAASLDGKVLVDTTNPLDFSTGKPRLSLAGNDSAGEQVQRLAPGAKVVKAFNSVGNAHMFKPSFPGGPPDMFICGNDAEAKKKVGGLLKDFGWGVIDLGGIESSRYLEPLCLVWVLHGMATNSWNHAFKMLHK
jgi:predicted dinucleotide-binding enzyme